MHIDSLGVWDIYKPTKNQNYYKFSSASGMNSNLQQLDLL